MKRLMIISLFMTVFATGCFFYEEADTVNPEDVTSTNTGTAPGGVTTFTATVTGPTLTNKTARIEFSSPVNASSIDYDTSIAIQHPIGTDLIYGAVNDYTAFPTEPLSEATSVIYLNLTNTTFISGQTVRIILSSSLNTDANNTVYLSTPYIFDFPIP